MSISVDGMIPADDLPGPQTFLVAEQENIYYSRASASSTPFGISVAQCALESPYSAMPGRRSTGAPSVKQLKSKKSAQKAGKRSLDALAIAEQQHPQRLKHRQSRLGEIEKNPVKRKRDGPPEDSEDEDADDARRRKMPRAGDMDRFGNEIEGGSDSEGNEWVLGQVGNEDDSDLDSDEAMGESDEEKFEGFMFHGSSTAKQSKKFRRKSVDDALESDDFREIDLDEGPDEEHRSEDEDEYFGDEGVDLATMLDASDKEAEEPEKTEDTGQGRREACRSKRVDHNTDTESEEEEESELSNSEDEESTADATRLASLQQLVSTMNDQESKHGSCHKPIPDAQETTTPSEYGLNPKQKLTIADLLPSITDPQLKKSLKLLADNDAKPSSKRTGIPKKLDVPLAERQQDRLDRAAAYEKSKETLNRWIDTVKHNRRAEHLSFPLQDPEAVAAQGTQRLLPTSHSQPITDLENTIQSILHESGLTLSHNKSEEDQLQAFEELETRKMPIEEVQARRAELRQARELLFREEIRAKRIKKIKSKSYRRVHRKERERMVQQEKDALAAAGVDNSESEQERQDRRRAEERMGARHRESKWARGVKDSGRAAWDDDARSGVTQMARRGEELRKRIEGKEVAGEDDISVSSESASEEENAQGSLEDGDQKEARRLHRRLQQLRMSGNGQYFEAQGPGSSLTSLKFMRHAESQRKSMNDAEVENMRRELAGEEISSNEDTMDGPGRRTYGPMKDKASRAKFLQNQERSEFEEKGSDEENEIAFQDPDEEDLEIVVDTADGKGNKATSKKHSVSRDYPKRSSASVVEPPLEMIENPWLSSSTKKTNNRDRKAQDSQAPAIITNTLPENFVKATKTKVKPRSTLKGARNEERNQQGLGVSDAKESLNVIDSEAEDEEEGNGQMPFILRNQDLVRKAFAGDEVVADFEKEKADIVGDEDERIVDATLPGWGNWTGEGVSKKVQKGNKGRILKKEEGVARDKRKDAKLERVVINEKRVKKNAKYLASNLPHPFENRQQYERSLRLPVGPEWTTKETFQSATKPRILMKQGIIAPMAKPII